MSDRRNAPGTDQERFVKYVDNSEHDGCWPWTGAIDAGGYGRFYSNASGRRDITAQRMAYLLSGRTIPNGYQIDHLCRNRRCVNPAHLEAVTPAENSRRARKSVCVRGHELSGENVREYLRPGDNQLVRQCRSCQRWHYHNRKNRLKEVS